MEFVLSTHSNTKIQKATLTAQLFIIIVDGTSKCQHQPLPVILAPAGVDKILTIQQLPTEDKEHILFAIDALLRDAKARATYS